MYRGFIPSQNQCIHLLAAHLTISQRLLLTDCAGQLEQSVRCTLINQTELAFNVLTKQTYTFLTFL